MEKINVEKITEDINKVKIAFSKEILELNKMIEEELGESKGYYRITLISQLIEKDMEELIKITCEQVDIANVVNQLNQDTEKLLKIKDNLIKDKKVSDLDNIIDPVSQIVKYLNTLDDDSKKQVMYYVSGFTNGYNKNKYKQLLT